ncbi:UDP-glycosyltransferase 88A1 [Vitis vinifera]|uniref:UDP-glycosyltransferase 88A1 n=1 Tax=Vitis vinifera TaxID=29760 RepID=A0A438ID53_VITVI|nr:UDP-glycosyltransferase 88A1 [Vitis vinifera]
MSIHLPRSAGIIVNTFEALEPRAVKTILDGLCVLDGPTPPIFCIGPLIAADDRSGGGGVVEGELGFVLRRTVEGDSGWVREEWAEVLVGSAEPTLQGPEQAFFSTTGTGFEFLLPDGFLDRTKERGLMVKSWAPQVAVLNHASVGGFVTHCGWNSVLEAVCAGVPMVAWPLYAEQRFNRVVMVEEMKLAFPMEESEEGFVTATEVEKRVRELMESEEGRNTLRLRIMAMKEAAETAMSDGGSSRTALTKLVKSWRPG